MAPGYVRRRSSNLIVTLLALSMCLFALCFRGLHHISPLSRAFNCVSAKSGTTRQLLRPRVYSIRSGLSTGKNKPRGIGHHVFHTVSHASPYGLRRYAPKPVHSSVTSISIGNQDISPMLDVAMKASREAGVLIKEKLGADIIKTKYNSMDLLTEVDGRCQEIILEVLKSEFPDHGYLGEESVGPGADASREALNDALDNHDWVWIIDPIDGTTNFASGLSLAGTIIALAYKGEVVMGVIYDPFNDEMFHTVRGHGAFLNEKKISVNDASNLQESVILTGSPPNPRSIAPTLRSINELMPKARTIRMLGSAAIMLAAVAAGRSAAYFEPDLNAWDSAAGVLLVQEAGGKVTDLEGNPWKLTTRALCATNGKMHSDLLDVTMAVKCTGMDPP